MARRWHRGWALVTAWITTGCDPKPSVDGGSDAAMVDTGTGDAGSDAGVSDAGTDAEADVVVASDLGDSRDTTTGGDVGDAGAGRVECPRFGAQPPERRGAICDAENVVDLNAMGAPARTYLGWVDAPVRPDSALLALSCLVSGSRDYNRQVAHRYRMRSAARLRATTDLLGSYCGPEGRADTFVAIVRACDTTRDPTENALGCTDGNIPAIGGPGTVVSSEVIPAGTEVFVVVGTIARATPVEPIAPYELGVDEVPPAAPDGPCSPEANPSDPDTAGECPMGYRCVAPTEISTRGRCLADGSAPLARCRPAVADGGVDGGVDGGAAARCDLGLVCQSINTPGGVCMRPVEYGGECDHYADACRRISYWNCVVRDPSDPSHGVCTLAGSVAGAACMTPSLACIDGLSCSGDNLTASCRATVARGDTCDPEGRTTVCEPGASCAPTEAEDRFVCRADGSVAGSACRDAAPRCDAGLTCNTAAGAGVCQVTLAAEATRCDPRYASQRCADGAVCLATGHRTGRCVTPVGEGAGDNNHPLLATPISLPAAVRGAISTAGDSDCVAFDLPARSTLRAETSDGAGGCPARIDTVITVHDAEGRVIDGNDDYQQGQRYCSGVDGAWRNSQLRDLAAGRYTVCVWAFWGATPVGPYVLSVTATAP